jgi:hypothetical protein
MFSTICEVRSELMRGAKRTYLDRSVRPDKLASNLRCSSSQLDTNPRRVVTLLLRDTSNHRHTAVDTSGRLSFMNDRTRVLSDKSTG